MIKGFFLTIILFLVGVLLSLILIWVIGAEDIAKAIEQLDSGLLIPILGLLALETIVSTFRWKYIMNAMGEKIPLKSLVPIWLAGNAFNYLSPVVYVGGEAIRIFLLKKRFKIPYHKGSASVFLDQIFNGLSVWPMVVFGVIIFLSSISSDEVSIVFFVIFLVTAGIFSFLLFAFVQLFRRKPVISNFLYKFNLQHGRVGSFIVKMEEEALSFGNVGMKLFWNALALSFARQSIILARTALILVALGSILNLEEILVSIKDTVIISTSIYVSYLIPIPMALGAQEASGIGLFELVGWSAAAGILFTTIYRASELVMVFSGVVVIARSFTAYAFRSLWDVMKDMKNKQNKTYE